MAVNVILHQFANDVGPIPLSLLDSNFAALTTALASLDTYANLYTDIGTQNAVNVQTPAWQQVSYVDGLTIQIRPAATNTGPATININGLGPVPILNNDGTQLGPNQLVAGQLASLTYDAKRNAFILNPGGGAAETITSPTTPSNPVEGQFWFNTSNGQLAIYTGGAWVAACCCTGTGATSGNLFAPPFTVGGPDHACLQVNADCSVSLGNGLTMEADGHTWLYQGLTTYPTGGLSGNGNSVRVHGNQTDTSPWLMFVNDTTAAETDIGGIGGGSIFPVQSNGNPLNPQAMQFLAPQGFAFGVAQGGVPCMSIGPDCVVTFRQSPIVPILPQNITSQQAVSADWVMQQIEAQTTPPGSTQFAANGYTTLPGGVILQWGSVTAPAGEFPVDVAVTFPKAFPHACWHVNATTLRSIARAGEANLASHFVDYITTSGCTIVIDNQGNPSTYYGQWLAIGY
jgi:hypothetical protein